MPLLRGKDRIRVGAVVFAAMAMVMCARAAAGAGGATAEARGAAGMPGKPAYVSRIWRTQEGLPENRVRAIAQTPDGYLWIGTPSGLARFDGVRFVVYGRFNTGAFRDDNVRALSVAPDGSLWIGTDGGGVVHYKNGRFERFGAGEGLESEFVSSVVEDRGGAVWAATNRGLYRREGGKFVRLDRELARPNQVFFVLGEPGAGGRCGGGLAAGGMLAGGQAGIVEYASGKLRLSAMRQEREEVFRMRWMRDGSLWLGTNQGLRTIGREVVDFSRLRTTAVGALAEDHAGNVWIGTLGDGVYMVRAGQRAAVQVAAGLPDSSVISMLEDREHAVWLGTADGLVRLTEPDVHVLDRRDGLSDENVVTAYCSQDGGVWLTTVTGELYRYRDGEANQVRLPAPADGLRFLGVYEDSKGAMWLGTDNQGAVRWSGGLARRFTMAEGLRNNGIQFFHDGKDGTVWIGTTSGIGRWDGTQLRNYYIEDGLSYGWVRSIAEDANGDLLIGTDRGLNRVREGKFVKDPAFDEVSRDRVWAIYRDGTNTLWLGTRGGGLLRAKDGKLRRLTTQDGLISNSIFQILGGDDGRLWMSGPLGLSSASIADLNAAAEGRLGAGGVLAHRVGSGLESAQMNGGVQPAGCVARDGELWFPGVKGAIHFKSKRPKVWRHSPVRLEGVWVDDRPVAANGELVLGPGRQRVRFEFTSCTLSSPESVSFRYKLEGFDPDWVTATGARAASYDNVPPGSYRFRVVAHDDSVGSRPTEAGVGLLVTPHFYQTGWFYALALAGVGTVVAGVFLLRERRARERYTLRLAERTRIAREMHDTVVQGCVGISTLVEAAAGSAPNDQVQMMAFLDSARIHLRLTLDEARQALTDLRFDSFDHGLAGAVREMAAAIQAEKGVPVVFEVEGAAVALPDSVNRALLLVTREAIRNAVQHAGPKEVRVRLRYESGGLVLEIRDDGRGFEPPAADVTDLGHFGIVGMRERMEQLGGSVELVSAPGKGTTVTVRLAVAPGAMGPDPIRG